MMNLKRLMACSIAVACLAGLVGAGAASARTVKLRWSMWPAQPEEVNIWKGWIKDFERDNPGVKITMEFPGDYIQSTLVSTAAGTAPDIIRTHSDYIYDWSSRGIIRPLDDYIKKDKAISPTDWFNTVREMASYKGKVYGLPSDYSTYMVFYNPTAFSEAGLLPPSAAPDDSAWTWEDFVTAAKKTMTYQADGKVKRWGFANEELERFYSSLLWQNGGRYFTAKKDNIAFQSQEAIEAVNFASDLVNRHKAMILPFKAAGYRDLFMTGKAAMVMDGSWMKSTFSLKKNLTYGGALMPIRKTRASWVGASMWCLSPAGRNKDMAWKFISYISTKGMHMFADKNGSDTGVLLPPMRAAYSDPQWKPGPVTQVATRQLEHGYIEQIPNIAGFNQVIWPQVLKVMSGRIEAKPALDQIVAQAKRFLPKR